MKKMLREKNKRMLKAKIEQFSQSAIVKGRKELFLVCLRPTLRVEASPTLLQIISERWMV